MLAPYGIIQRMPWHTTNGEIARKGYADFLASTCSAERDGVVGSTLAFGSTGRGFDPERHYFSHHRTSA